jgi:hypothetical protein
MKKTRAHHLGDPDDAHDETDSSSQSESSYEGPSPTAPKLVRCIIEREHVSHSLGAPKATPRECETCQLCVL